MGSRFHLLRRLENLDRRHPLQDVEAVEAALARHFRILGIARPKRVTWYPTTREAWDDVVVPLEDGDRDWCAFERRVVDSFVQEKLDPERWWDQWRVDGVEPLDQALRAAWSEEERELLMELEFDSPLGDPECPAAPLRCPAVLAACLLRSWELEPTDRRALLALLEAAEAGLWVFWPRRDETAVVMRPSIWEEGGRLHRWEGPAVLFQGGPTRHYWRGVRVPAATAERWESIGMADILREPNVEVRRVMLERYGTARFLEESGAKAIHQDACGRLFRIDIPGDEPLVLVKVVNATPEPDGTRRDYVLRVPPEARTAREAVAWTFDLSEGEYAPAAES